MDRFRNTRQPDWDWWGRLWPTPGETLRRLGVSPGDTLVEVGSGNGYFALPAARIVEPAPVYALDVDDALLAELDRLADLQGVDNVVSVHADARSLGECLPDPVDVAVVANTFHGIETPAAVVGQVDGALADDGRLVVVNWRALPRSETTVAGDPRGPPTDLRLTPAETRARVTAGAEFATSRLVDLPPYHYGLAFER